MNRPLIEDKNKVVFIMGPTASGKTDTAISLAQNYNIEIINADAAQVYQQMDIGTAKPSAEELAQAPHKLIDFIDPAASYSAAAFRDDALLEIEQALAKNKTPVLVGGSMFYFKALESGLSVLPAADQTVRQRIEKKAEKVGWAALHEKLSQVDPQIAKTIDKNDPQRIQRAFEIYEITGLTPSESFKRSQSSSMSYQAIKIVMMPSDRAKLHQRIEQRFMKMLELGLIEEVEQLRGRGDLSLELPSMRTVGYRQVWLYLDAKVNHQQMIDQAVAATRQLAKRQLTWLRNQPGLVWFVGYNGVDYDSVQRYFA